MPEPVIDNQNPNTPTGTNPTPPENGSSQTPVIDLKNLTAEQLAQVYENPNLYNHPRFKDLSIAKKERDDLLQKQKDLEDKTLAEQNKFKELAEKRETEVKELKSNLTNQRIDTAIERTAIKAGISDSEAALKLISRGTITVTDTGEITGVEDAVKQLVTDKPYLTGSSAPTLGSPSNPDGSQTQLKRFKLSQTQNAEFFKKNEADILASMKAGLVENDLAQS